MQEETEQDFLSRKRAEKMEVSTFRKIVKHFGPEWGAAVMGTAALSITLQLASEVARPFSPLLYVGLGFYFLATILFVSFLIPWTLRFFWYPMEVKKDLLNPIRGNFFPTMPISFILAGTGTNKLGPLLFGPSVAYIVAIVFFFVGAAGIFIFGYLLLRNQFLNGDLGLKHANFAWFIPPVSHLIIPVLGACSMDVHWAETALAPWLYIISMVALGAGFFNFLFVGSAIWHRYVYASIPTGRLAATTMVAIAPTAILVVFLMKFAEAVEASHGMLFGLEFVKLLPSIKTAASVLWGFSFWWLLVALIMFCHYFSQGNHPVAFAWWAYTFPFEAFIVATGLLAKWVATGILNPLLIILNLIALIVWVVVVFGTLKWLQNGNFLEVEHPERRPLDSRLVLTGLAIVLMPFLLGIGLFSTSPNRSLPDFLEARNNENGEEVGLGLNGLELDCSFFGTWPYQSFLLPAEEYYVFVFHYKNISNLPIHVTPSYTFTSKPSVRYAANEEIAAYLENVIEDELGVTDETAMAFSIGPGVTKHDIATFRKPPRCSGFDVYVELFEEKIWRLHYKIQEETWLTTQSKIEMKYHGRG